MNPWLFVFFVSVLIFLLLVDCHTFKLNVWAGVICYFSSN